MMEVIVLKDLSAECPPNLQYVSLSHWGSYRIHSDSKMLTSIYIFKAANCIFKPRNDFHFVSHVIT